MCIYKNCSKERVRLKRTVCVAFPPARRHTAPRPAGPGSKARVPNLGIRNEACEKQVRQDHLRTPRGLGALPCVGTRLWNEDPSVRYVQVARTPPEARHLTLRGESPGRGGRKSVGCICTWGGRPRSRSDPGFPPRSLTEPPRVRPTGTSTGSPRATREDDFWA